MDITANIEVDKERMERVQTKLNINLQRISLECRSLMKDCANYRQRTRNANREDHRQTIIEALAHVNLQIQHIDSSILNIRNRFRIINFSIYCGENTVKTLEAEIKHLLWEKKIKEEVNIHKKLERILTKYKSTI